MREYLNANSIASAVRMLRATFQGSILLVEGEIDVRLLRRLVDERACHLQICYNRSNVIGVVSILDAVDFAGHLGLIDRDFSDLFDERFESENLVLTDQNDMEMIIFESEAFERFLAEYANPEKVTGLESSATIALREIIVSSASVIGALRYLSRLYHWNLVFEGMTIRFAGRDTIVIDLEGQIEHLRSRSQPTTMPTANVVKSHVAEAMRQFPSRRSFAAGHDVCEIICRGVHHVFGRAHVALGRTGIAVEEVLRAAFSPENFAGTGLFANIRSWEATHRPFRVLPV